MDARTLERLERIKNRQTAYELTITHPDGRKFLVCYSCRQGREAIFDAVSNEDRVAAIVKLTGDGDIHFAPRAADGATMGDWSIRFSGRTQRECILGSGGPELEYIGNLD